MVSRTVSASTGEDEGEGEKLTVRNKTVTNVLDNIVNECNLYEKGVSQYGQPSKWQSQRMSEARWLLKQKHTKDQWPRSPRSASSTGRAATSDRDSEGEKKGRTNDFLSRTVKGPKRNARLYRVQINERRDEKLVRSLADGESQRCGLLREVKVGGLASRSFQGRHYIGRGNFGKRGAPLDSAWSFWAGGLPVPGCVCRLVRGGDGRAEFGTMINKRSHLRIDWSRNQASQRIGRLLRDAYRSASRRAKGEGALGAAAWREIEVAEGGRD